MNVSGVCKDFREGCADFGDHTFMNFAGLAPMPLSAVEAATRAARAKAMPHAFEPGAFFNGVRTVRCHLAGLIGADPQDIAVTTGAGAGTAQVASSLDFKPGDEIVLVAQDFPSHDATWRPVADRYGASLKIADFDTPEQIPERLCELITPATRLVSVSHVRFDDGSRLDVAPVASACSRNGALLLLDVSQSVGIVPLDVAALDADFLVGVGYKYLMGPWGTGFLWISPEVSGDLRPAPWNWVAQDVNSFSDLSYVTPRPARGAARFDAAQTVGPFNINLAAWEASLCFLERFPQGMALDYTQNLIDRLLEALPPRCRRLTPTDRTARGAAGCFAAESSDATADLYTFLIRKKFSISARNGRIRIAPHLLNREAEIDRLIKALRQWASL